MSEGENKILIFMEGEKKLLMLIFMGVKECVTNRYLHKLYIIKRTHVKTKQKNILRDHLNQRLKENVWGSKNFWKNSNLYCNSKPSLDDLILPRSRMDGLLYSKPLRTKTSSALN